MKRWIIISVTVFLTLLFATLGFFTFALKKMSQVVFWVIMIVFLVFIFAGIIIYFIRTSKQAEKPKEEGETIKFKDSEEIKSYAKRVLTQSEEPNYLVDIEFWRYTAGRTETQQTTSVFGVVEGDAVFYENNYGWVHYAVVIDLRKPEIPQIYKWKKEESREGIKRWLMEMMDKSADQPKENQETTQRITDPMTGRIIETRTPNISKREKEAQAEAQAQTLEATP